MELLEAALEYRAAGLSVLPAKLADKRPALLNWKSYQSALPSEDQVRTWFQAANALCVVTGAVSGNLEMLDFDQAGELFDAWCERVHEADPELLDRLVIESSPSGGRHVVYRCADAVDGNMKLAQRKHQVESDAFVELCGKRYTPRKETDGRFSVLLTLIETRGEGGIFLCAPSTGYVLQHGSFARLAMVTSEEREILLEAARSINEHIALQEIPKHTKSGAQRPGDDFNQRGDVGGLLIKHGWSRVKSGENEYWRRPGKSRGWSATLKGGVLYVFSSGAAPFEPNKAYAPFSVYAHLEHDGDYARAAAALSQSGFGLQKPSSESPDVQTEVDNDVEVLTPAELFAFNTADDPTTLLGDRWLCRGGSCLIVGPTGIGKSAFGMQATIIWALGKSLFGITPKHPLRSLIIQAENDVGDLAEMFRGVLRGIACESRLDELQSMLTFVSESSRSGRAFHPWVVSLIEKYKPDLVWIDPLFAFLGGSASDQETVSKFLRNGLGAVARQTGVVWMIIHHTNKPNKDPEIKNSAVASDFSYLSSGSAELANWPRAVLTLREMQDGLYELRAAKRHRRAGLLDADGQAATEIFLKHGERGICWERAAARADERVEVESEIADEIIANLESGKIYDKAEIRKLVESAMHATRSTITTPGRPANRVWHLVMERTQISLQPGCFSGPKSSAATFCEDSCNVNGVNGLNLPRRIE